MQKPFSAFAAVLLVFACAEPAPIQAQAAETVTITRSRLMELERKEAELDAIKGRLQKTEGENQTLKTQRDAAEKKAATIAAESAPVAKHVSPPIATLLPLEPSLIIDAKDLGDYLQHDPSLATKRFDNQQIKVRGEIVGFAKGLFTRNYQVLLRTADRDLRIECDFYPPERFSAVFVAKNGAELVGLQRETRVPIAKSGQIVVVTGRCKGLAGGAVKMVGCAWEDQNPAK